MTEKLLKNAVLFSASAPQWLKSFVFLFLFFFWLASGKLLVHRQMLKKFDGFAVVLCTTTIEGNARGARGKLLGLDTVGVFDRLVISEEAGSKVFPFLLFGGPANTQKLYSPKEKESSFWRRDARGAAGILARRLGAGSICVNRRAPNARGGKEKSGFLGRFLI